MILILVKQVKLYLKLNISATFVASVKLRGKNICFIFYQKLANISTTRTKKIIFLKENMLYVNNSKKSKIW